MNQNNPAPLIPPPALGRSIARRGFIWQMDFLTPDKLRDFVNARGLYLGLPDIKKLWELGLLRADYVLHSQKRRHTGFRRVGQNEDGAFVYSDVRRLSAVNAELKIAKFADQKLPSGW